MTKSIRPAMDADSLQALRTRLSDKHLGRRLEEQTHHAAAKFGGGGIRLYWENFSTLPIALRYGLKLTGLYHRAVANALSFVVEQVNVPIAGLPPAFDGLRIAHLSDLHIDGMPDGGERLRQVIAGLDFDLCVLTGDFRFATHGDYRPALQGMARLLEEVRCPHGILGILGNHDYIEMVPGLEAAGVRMLLNEAVALRRNGTTLWVAGLDDTHYYEASDLDKALQKTTNGEIRILLAHSPEIIPQAAAAGVHYYLCGHSHGGQVCLPGRVPIIGNSRCARRYLSGPWRYGRMSGYTTRGTGSSGLAARLFCPPEVAVHTLRRASRKAPRNATK